MTAPIASGWSEIAGWALHPLESAAFSRRTPKAVVFLMLSIAPKLPFARDRHSGCCGLPSEGRQNTASLGGLRPHRERHQEVGLDAIRLEIGLLERSLATLAQGIGVSRADN